MNEYIVSPLVLNFLLPNCWMMAGIIDRIVLLVENIRPSKYLQMLLLFQF